MTRGLRIFIVALLTLSVVAGGAPGLASADTETADLAIIQEGYIDHDIQPQQTDGERIYEVKGPRQIIALQNVDHANVTAYGVADGGGEFRYDEANDQFIFEPSGNGTVTLYWTAEVQEGNATVTNRYEAVLQVSAVAWTHRTQGDDAALREKANKYEEIQSEVERHFPNRGTQDVIESALVKEIFFESPFSTLVNDMRGVLLMMALRPGGWIIGGLFLGIALLGVASGARYKNKKQKQLRDIGDIEIEKTEAYLKKARRILSNTDYNEFLPDDAARAMRDHLGRNPWIGFKNYLLLRSPTSTKGTVLQMMAQLGYVGKQKTAADGGVDDAWVEKADDDTATDGGAAVDTIELGELDYENDDDRAFIEHVPGEELDFDVFSADIDFDAVSFPISNREVDDAELLEELDPHFPDDFADEEHLARALGELIAYVVNHEHTDALGQSERELDLLSFLAEMDSVLADEADFPLGHVQRRMLTYIADNMEKEAEMTETVDRLDEEGVQ